MHKSAIRAIVFLAICAWGAYEAVCGLWQILGPGVSGNARFAMTGNFLNPGPLGGFLAISMGITGSYIIRYRKRHKGIYRRILMAAAVTSFCLCFIVLPASLSRAAWLALAAALLAALLREQSVGLWIKSHRTAFAIVCLSAILLCAGAFFLKKDSAIGRLHIWRIECRAIAENPFGTGRGTVLGTYGKVQEEFFREHLDSVPDVVVRVAGCPEYAFNEYLHVGIEYGIAGMFLFVAVLAAAIIALVRSKSIYAGGLIAWAVFAFASYPFDVPRINILFCILLAEAAVHSRFPVPVRGTLAVCSILCGIYLCRQSSERPEFRDIYDKGYNEFLSGEYEESLRTLAKGANLSSDPLFHVIMGRDYEALGKFKAAEDEYWKARHMVPCRIYPLARLTRLYIRSGRDREALDCANAASGMPVNEKHLSMVRLRDEMTATRDSLEVVLSE